MKSGRAKVKKRRLDDNEDEQAKLNGAGDDGPRVEKRRDKKMRADGDGGKNKKRKGEKDKERTKVKTKAKA